MQITLQDVLLVIDVQNDFLPGGALAVADGDAIIPLIDRLARAYQVNGFLRKMRFKPTPPGINPSRDRLKISALSLLDKKKPKNKYELIRSGAARVRDSIHFVGKLGKR